MIIPKHRLFVGLVSKKTKQKPVTFNQKRDIYLARRVEGEGKTRKEHNCPY